MTYAVNWGMALANDHKGRNARKWQSMIRSIATKLGIHSESGGGLTGAALEQAVMAITVRDPGLVKVTAAGS